MPVDGPLSRKEFVISSLLAAAGAALPGAARAADQGGTPGAIPAAQDDVTIEDLKSVEKIAGIGFTDEERTQVLSQVRALRRGYEVVRQQPIDFAVEPSTVFTPLGGHNDPDAHIEARPTGRAPSGSLDPDRLAFMSVRDLAHLVKARRVSPVELTELYLERLKRYGDKLLCVVNLTEKTALQAAARAEREISEGRYRGPLHGIPYGLKDLFSVKGYPTTWGANVFEDQSFPIDSTVAERLDQAGAILVAKLSLGTFAMGDVWFRGTTKNPWNPSEGSSGSSAGSASATAAGLVGFSIGTETFGSIVSPSARCRVTGLRPTYGRVSRYGGMALSYTLDKVGPICREAEDCALVFAAIAGSDPRDPSAVRRSFSWPPRVDIRELKVGYLVPGGFDINDRSREREDPALALLTKLGVKLRPVKFTPMPNGISIILGAETGSAFDAFTRGEPIRQLKGSSWPVTFRQARYVGAVEYLQAQRARTLFMRKFEEELGDLDAVIARGIGESLINTNYTGHPQVLIPFGVDDRGQAQSRSLIGRLYREDVLLALAKAFQDAAGFHRSHPDLSKL